MDDHRALPPTGQVACTHHFHRTTQIINIRLPKWMFDVLTKHLKVKVRGLYSEVQVPVNNIDLRKSSIPVARPLPDQGVMKEPGLTKLSKTRSDSRSWLNGWRKTRGITEHTEQKSTVDNPDQGEEYLSKRRQTVIEGTHLDQVGQENWQSKPRRRSSLLPARMQKLFGPKESELSRPALFDLRNRRSVQSGSQNDSQPLNVDGTVDDVLLYVKTLPRVPLSL
ncbi:unnamed protein product [Echinostoma caproni]|uniref:Movement protein n=1 Tax=Echinostoma caproni TaxID=27848 RepID=A0A183BC89_9TREM|nr:unnamed protein product [Echinostoma caproni]